MITRLKIAATAIALAPIATFAGIGVGTMINDQPPADPTPTTSSLCREVAEDSRWWDGYRHYPTEAVR